MDHHKWDEKQYEIAVGALKAVGALCAKNATASPLDVAWCKLKEAGYKMDKETLHVCLYVSSTFSSRSARSLVPSNGRSVLDFLDGIESKPEPEEKSELVEENDSIDVMLEVALCHDLLFEPSEQSLSIRVRKLVSLGEPRKAEVLLDSSFVSFTFFSFD